MSGNRFLRLVLVAFATFFFIINSAVQPAVAQWDTATTFCRQRAVECGEIFGVKAATAAPLATTGQATSVAAQVLSPTGQVLGTSFAGTFTPAAASTSAIVVSSAGAGVMAGATVGAILSLQNKAEDRYCNLNGCEEVDLRVDLNCVGGSVTCSTTATTKVILPGRVTPAFETIDSPGFNPGINLIFPDGSTRELRFGPFSSSQVAVSNPTTVVTKPRQPWSDWSQAQRISAVATLTPSEIGEAVTDGDAISDITGKVTNLIRNDIRNQYQTLVNNNTTNITANNFNTNYSIKLITTPQTVPLVNTSTQFITNNQTFNTTNFDTTFNTQVTNQVTNMVTTIINTGTLPNPDSSPSPSPGPSPSPSPSPSTGTSIRVEIPEPIGEIPVDPQKDECPDSECQQRFDKPNFLTYAKEKFAGKFPFDIVGNIDDLRQSSTQCPKITVWGREREVCEVRQILSAVKYPVILGYLIRILLSI